MNRRLIWVFFAAGISVWHTGLHADDVAKGRDYFLRHCIGCHAFACNKAGPSLGGLFGRMSAGAEGYDGYSEGLKNAKITWDQDTLDEFFKNPGKIVESTMADNGQINDAEQRKQVIAFLKTEDSTVNICPQ